MNQNKFTELSGKEFLRICNENDKTNAKNMTIQIIGNPNNTRKYIFRGRSGFLNIYPEIFNIIIAFSTFASKLYHGGMISQEVFAQRSCPIVLSESCPSELSKRVSLSNFQKSFSRPPAISVSNRVFHDRSKESFSS